MERCSNRPRAVAGSCGEGSNDTGRAVQAPSQRHHSAPHITTGLWRKSIRCDSRYPSRSIVEHAYNGLGFVKYLRNKTSDVLIVNENGSIPSCAAGSSLVPFPLLVARLRLAVFAAGSAEEVGAREAIMVCDRARGKSLRRYSRPACIRRSFAAAASLPSEKDSCVDHRTRWQSSRASLHSG